MSLLAKSLDASGSHSAAALTPLRVFLMPWVVGRGQVLKWAVQATIYLQECSVQSGKERIRKQQEEGKKAAPGRHWRVVRGIQDKVRKQRSWKGWMASLSQDAEWSRAWESEELSVVAPGRSEPGKEGHKVLPATKRELQGIAPWKMGKQILKSNSKELSWMLEKWVVFESHELLCLVLLEGDQRWMQLSANCSQR